MSAKITIVEGNSNDKDNLRNFMVKGEAGTDGVSPTVETSKTGNTATIVITDAEGEHEVQLTDGVSPIITTSKTGKVTTITIVDAEGTKTATVNDGDVNVINTFDTTLDKTTNAPSINAVENYVDDYFETYGNNKYAVFTGSITNIAAGQTGSKSITLPTGFTALNSVPISVVAGEVEGSYSTSSQGSNIYFFMDYEYGNTLYIENTYGETKTLYYKLVLMRLDV